MFAFKPRRVSDVFVLVLLPPTTLVGMKLLNVRENARENNDNQLICWLSFF